jgi:hypothetical protein
MVTPGPRLTPTPPLAMPFVLGNSRLGIGDTRKPPSFDTLDVLCDLGGFLRLSCGIGFSSLGGQLARVDDEKAELGHVLSPVSIFHGHVASDALPVPAARWLLTRAARFFEQERQRAALLAPRFQLLAYHTRARDERDQADTLLYSDATK